MCKKEVSSKYFLKVHMATAHGLGEDGAPLPPHMRGGPTSAADSSSLLGMFPSLADFPPPPVPPPHPGMGEFSRLLMQQGEKNMLKELDRLKAADNAAAAATAAAAAGHICSLCSNTFPDIVTLQVHIIKSHGALPPGAAGLDGILGKSRADDRSEQSLPPPAVADDDEKMEDGVCGEEDEAVDREKEAPAASAEDDDITDRDEEMKAVAEKLRESPQPLAPPPPFGFPLDVSKLGAAAASGGLPLNDLLARQMLGAGGVGAAGAFPGLMNPLLGLPVAAGGGGAANQQFHGLFNMILSEMLKKVQKDTPPQTPPVSPRPDDKRGMGGGGGGPEEDTPATRMEEATS